MPQKFEISFLETKRVTHHYTKADILGEEITYLGTDGSLSEYGTIKEDAEGVFIAWDDGTPDTYLSTIAGKEILRSCQI